MPRIIVGAFFLISRYCMLFAVMFVCFVCIYMCVTLLYSVNNFFAHFHPTRFWSEPNTEIIYQLNKLLIEEKMLTVYSSLTCFIFSRAIINWNRANWMCMQKIKKNNNRVTYKCVLNAANSWPLSMWQIELEVAIYIIMQIYVWNGMRKCNIKIHQRTTTKNENHKYTRKRI